MCEDDTESDETECQSEMESDESDEVESIRDEYSDQDQGEKNMQCQDGSIEMNFNDKAGHEFPENSTPASSFMSTPSPRTDHTYWLRSKNTKK